MPRGPGRPWPCEEHVRPQLTRGRSGPYPLSADSRRTLECETRNPGRRRGREEDYEAADRSFGRPSRSPRRQAFVPGCNASLWRCASGPLSLRSPLLLSPLPVRRGRVRVGAGSRRGFSTRTCHLRRPPPPQPARGQPPIPLASPVSTRERGAGSPPQRQRRATPPCRPEVACGFTDGSATALPSVKPQRKFVLSETRATLTVRKCEGIVSLFPCRRGEREPRLLFVSTPRNHRNFALAHGSGRLSNDGRNGTRHDRRAISPAVRWHSLRIICSRPRRPGGCRCAARACFHLFSAAPKRKRRSECSNALRLRRP